MEKPKDYSKEIERAQKMVGRRVKLLDCRQEICWALQKVTKKENWKVRKKGNRLEKKLVR